MLHLLLGVGSRESKGSHPYHVLPCGCLWNDGLGLGLYLYSYIGVVYVRVRVRVRLRTLRLGLGLGHWG